MSDAEQNLDIQVEEIDYKAKYEQTLLQLETVAAHKEKLYTETKKAKADREEAAKLADQVRRDAEEHAKKNGEFERLFESKAKENEQLQKQLQDIMKGNRQEKVQISAMRIATELADGDNAELLSDFVQRSLDKLADDNGALSAEAINAVKDEFKNNGKFKALLRGSKAIGGGAVGNTSSAGDSKTVERTTFDKWNATKQMTFIKSGGRTVDSL